MQKAQRIKDIYLSISLDQKSKDKFDHILESGGFPKAKAKASKDKFDRIHLFAFVQYFSGVKFKDVQVLLTNSQAYGSWSNNYRKIKYQPASPAIISWFLSATAQVTETELPDLIQAIFDYCENKALTIEGLEEEINSASEEEPSSTSTDQEQPYSSSEEEPQSEAEQPEKTDSTNFRDDISANSYRVNHPKFGEGFTNKVLSIPSLKELGLEIGGLSKIEFNEELIKDRYKSQFAGLWVNRGERLFTYHFNYFDMPKKMWFGIFGDKIEKLSYEIESPISGLLVGMRQGECRIRGPLGISYDFFEEAFLPQILVPKREPIPDTINFIRLDNIVGDLPYFFDRLVTRDKTTNKGRLERLGDIIARGNSSAANEFNYIERYERCRKQLKSRSERTEWKYSVTEIGRNDHNIIRNIEVMMSNDMSLRPLLLPTIEGFIETI